MYPPHPSMNYAGGGGLSAQEREKLEEKLKNEKEKCFELQLEMKRMQAEATSKEQEQKAAFNKELQSIYGEVKSYEQSKREYKRSLNNITTFVQYCDKAMKKQSEAMNEGIQKLQSQGRRVDTLRRQVGVLQTALGRRNLVYRDLCTLYEAVFNVQAPRDIRDAMPELRGEFTALKKEKAILKQTLDQERYSLHQKSKNIEQELREELRLKEELLKGMQRDQEKMREVLARREKENTQLNAQNVLLQSEALKEKERRQEEVKQVKHSTTQIYEGELEELRKENQKLKTNEKKLFQKVESMEVDLQEKELVLEENKRRQQKEKILNKRKVKEAMSARDVVRLEVIEKNKEIQTLKMELEELKIRSKKEERYMRTEERRPTMPFKAEEERRIKTYRGMEDSPKREQIGGVNKQLDELEDFANELLNEDDDY